MEASTQEFHIDGSWVDPQITKVVRKPGSSYAPDASVESKPEAKPGSSNFNKNDNSSRVANDTATETVQ